MWPVYVVFGAGLLASVTKVAGCTSPVVSSPVSVWRLPPAIDVEPVTDPLEDVEHVLLRLVAVNCSLPELPTLASVAVAVTAPEGPVVPCVVTLMAPELKNVAGPALAIPDGAVAVIGVTEPPGGRVTVGIGPVTAGGPPNSETEEKYP